MNAERIVPIISDELKKKLANANKQSQKRKVKEPKGSMDVSYYERYCIFNLLSTGIAPLLYIIYTL